ncbi:MAG: hypothetical protein KatS3mg110_0640 [Pirellulaceae bacterium]|nr:MAG: hypothetical protein KatS3mg110_0640 [Pirellulaceae bacterium]
MVESNDPSVDCGAPVARILQALPHTPLFAIGNNLLLQAPAEDADTIRLPVRDRRWPELVENATPVGWRNDASLSTNRGLLAQMAPKHTTLLA